MTASELEGPMPRPRRTVSGKFLDLGVGLIVVLVIAVYFGFRQRFEAREARKETQHTASVASDAAVPAQLPSSVPAASLGTPVAQPPGSLPMNSVYGQPNTPQPFPGVAPVGSALQTIAHPFPDQPAPPLPQSSYQPPPQPTAAETQADLRMKAMERKLTRAQQAQEAPTGATAQHTTAASAPVDPLTAELTRLNAASSLGGPPPLLTQGRPAPREISSDPNGQGDKDQFRSGGETASPGYLKATRLAPLSRFVLQRGTVITAALPTKVVSDLPGDLIAEVSRDIYDSPSGKFLLIPAGSRLVGEYNSHVSYGQNRVQIAWTSIYFPDGSSLDLGRMPAHAADGSAGLADQVDNHLKRLIGGVALSSMLAAGLAVSQNRSSSGSVLAYPSAGQQAASAVGTQATELGAQITNRNLTVQPTLRIRPGEIFSVFINRDILFPGAYEPIR